MWAVSQEGASPISPDIKVCMPSPALAYNYTPVSLIPLLGGFDSTKYGFT